MPEQMTSALSKPHTSMGKSPSIPSGGAFPALKLGNEFVVECKRFLMCVPCSLPFSGSFDSMRTDIKANFEDVNYMGNALMGGAADGFMDETINETPYAYSTFVYDKFGGGMTET